MPEIAQQTKNEVNGLNLFTYCNNDPVNNSDPTGYKSYNYDNNVKTTNFIKDHKLVTRNFNCFSYAVGIYNYSINIPGFNSKSTISSCKKAVIKWLKNHNFRTKDVTNNGGCNYKTVGHTWLIALRIGYYKHFGIKTYDFHFMKRSNVNNIWSFKAGCNGVVYELKKGKTPENINWNIYGYKNTKILYEKVYFSEIVYLAISN